MSNELKPCPFCGGVPELSFRVYDTASYKTWGVSCCVEMEGDTDREKTIDAWNRRTAPVSAPLDTQVLPPLDKLPPFPEKKAGYLEQGANGVFLAYSWNPAAETRALFTEDQYRQGQRDAIAPYAERIRHLERDLGHARGAYQGCATALEIANRAAEAERKPVSIDTAEFRALAEKWQLCLTTDIERVYAELIAYIDGRTAGTAPDGRVEELERQVQALLDHCPDAECFTCGAAICPHGEPMHFHHDGCPACAQAEDGTPLPPN